MRTLVLAAGVLLVVAIAVFLGIGRWRNILNGRDLPKRLGANIQQEAHGLTVTQSHGGHMLFKIHASQAQELKSGHALLHDVKIEFYAKDGRTIDSIEGSDFEYDQKTGIASAQGKVEISLTRPETPSTTSAGKSGANKHGPVPSPSPTGIHVKTSGLRFNENTGVATTAEKVDFSLARGSGTAIGATYDSQHGYLVLDHAVELNTKRAGQTMTIHARHAEFERDAQLCQMLDATADYKQGQAQAGEAKLVFRTDGSAQRLDATNGFTVATTSGGRLEAPNGWLEFNEHNQPLRGDLRGGVKLNSVNRGRKLDGSAPGAGLQFSPRGELRRVELKQGVEMHSETQSGTRAGAVRVSRTWRSPTAYVDFRTSSTGRVEPASLHGLGGVVVATETQRGNAAPAPSRLAADEVAGEFGPDGELTKIIGTGHASMEEMTAEGARQTATGDKLEAQFKAATAKSGSEKSDGAATEIQSAILDGHVVFVEHPAAKHGTEAQTPLRAMAGRAVYENAGQWLHLTLSPRVEDGGLLLTADKIDVSQQSQKGFAYGNVKATWMQARAGNGRATGDAGEAMGAGGPAHVVSREAQFNRAGGEAVFRGHARLWQEANSISAPEIQLNREKQTLVARSSLRSEPVLAVLLNTRETGIGLEQAENSRHEAGARPGTPSVVRVRGGEFTYSEDEHRAVMASGSLGPVVAAAGGATCTARRVEFLLKARGAGNHAGSAEVERVRASGNVEVSSQGRRGAGEQLVYSGQTGDYVLTGTPAEPPRLTDPARGTVTGAALIFNSRNDSVRIEGGGRETRMVTTAPR